MKNSFVTAPNPAPFFNFDGNLFEKTFDAVVICDLEGRILRWNSAAVTQFGWREDEVLGEVVHHLLRLSFPSPREEIWSELVSRKHWEGEVVRRDRRGKAARVLGRYWLQPTGKDWPPRIVQVYANARINREQALQIVEDSRRSDDDLREFTHIVAHDLKEPLRMINIYLQLLSRKYEGHLDEIADEYIEFATSGAARMRRLLDGLLKISQVECSESEFGPVCAEMLLSRVRDSLRNEIAEIGGEVIWEKLPMIYGDGRLLFQLFRDLISNALKFSRPRERTKVWIRGENLCDRWLFSVEDNGIGISEAYHERIFQIFQRLHARQKYAGEGVGLAVCKKIIQVHRGKIWLESAVGQGANFLFTLAKPDSGLDFPAI